MRNTMTNPIGFQWIKKNDAPKKSVKQERLGIFITGFGGPWSTFQKFENVYMKNENIKLGSNFQNRSLILYFSLYP